MNECLMNTNEYMFDPAIPGYLYTCLNIFIYCCIVWKQYKCPSIGDRVNKLWHIHTVWQYARVKHNEEALIDLKIFLRDSYMRKWSAEEYVQNVAFGVKKNV